MHFIPVSKNSIKEIHISELEAALYILNLGIVLEIEEEEIFFVVIILRMNEKHVFRYHKNAKLWVYPYILNED